MYDTGNYKEINFSVSVIFENAGEAIIDPKDISQVIWFEDIFFYGQFGRIIVNDLYGIRENAPLEGDEKIKISYGIDEIITKYFKIHKINKITNTTSFDIGKFDVLNITFVEEHLEPMILKRFSKGWNNKKISEIVKHISKHMVGIDDFEEFEETVETLENFVMPYWTPGEALTWLMKRASSTKTRTPGYLYYTNRDGKYFITIESLLQRSKDEDENYLFECENMFYDNKILTWDQDGLDRTSFRDIAGTTRMGFDPYTKKLIFEKNKFSECVQKFTALGRKGLFKENIDEITSSCIVEGDPSTTFLYNIHYNDFIKAYVNQNIFRPVVKGNENRFAGMMIEVEWPSTVEGELFDKTLSGLYLVRGITHHFSPMTTPIFLQKLVCSKNAYEHIDSLNLVKTNKKNVASSKYK